LLVHLFSFNFFLDIQYSVLSAQRLALAAGRTGKTPPQTSAIASKPAPYHQGEALSAARIVGHPSRQGFGRLNHQLDNQT
jgi:hypothetical protein